jgi:hypothetical protein
MEGNDNTITWKCRYTYWEVGFNKCLQFNTILVPVIGTIMDVPVSCVYCHKLPTMLHHGKCSYTKLHFPKEGNDNTNT